MSSNNKHLEMGPTRKAWFNSHIVNMILYVGRSPTDKGIPVEFDNPEVGDPGRLTLQIRTKVMHVNLTSFNEQELDMFKKFVCDAVEEVRPTVQNLDRQSDEALESGNDVYIRSYRTPSTITYRRGFIPITDRVLCGTSDDEWEQQQHHQSLQERPDAVVGLPRNGRPHPEDR